MKMTSTDKGRLAAAVLTVWLGACQSVPEQSAWLMKDGIPSLALDGHCIQLRPLRPEEKNGFCYETMTGNYQQHHHYEPLDQDEFGFMYTHVDASSAQPQVLPESGLPGALRVGGLTVTSLPYSMRTNTQFPFGLNSAHLTARNRRALSQEFKALENRGLRVVSVSVTGHTESSGSAKFNELLSYWRAQSVAYYLRRIHIPEVEIAGVGMYAPRSTQDPADNRYVDLVVWVENGGPAANQVAMR
jgi:outer membrane protein OmpA-like peptidoglycan-associated protein